MRHALSVPQSAAPSPTSQGPYLAAFAVILLTRPVLVRHQDRVNARAGRVPAGRDEYHSLGFFRQGNVGR